ncbi:MAG: hypothetical protein KatS3mg093_144 [Candidatus Parcubacteria bacterium]|nr:MAG: hypothetical protein KatS3mg093_144 [Candidatus Parcubacteria bacterium]
MDEDFDQLWDKIYPLINSFIIRKTNPGERQDALQVARILTFEASKKFELDRFNFKDRGKTESFASFCCLLFDRKMWREIVRFRYSFSVPTYILENPAHSYRIFLEREKIVLDNDDDDSEASLARLIRERLKEEKGY